MSEFDEVEIDLDDVPEPVPVATSYPNADVWVREWPLPHSKRNPSSFRGDPRWFNDTEVVDSSTIDLIGTTSRTRPNGDVVTWNPFTNTFGVRGTEPRAAHSLRTGILS